jgi:quercetin dioxygenase-like cupin family protein
MNDFPPFMKNPLNQVDKTSQYSKDIEGYYYTANDGSQMAYWTCYSAGDAAEHTHEYDEYFIVAQGEYTTIINGQETAYKKGEECFIPKGTPHAGRRSAMTRTIHCFGGQRIT